LDNVKGLLSSNANASQLETSIKNEMSKLYSRVFDDHKGLEINEERQLNTWFRQELEPIFSKHGFQNVDTVQNYPYSVFGSSHPDLVFYKVCNGKMIATSLTLPSVNTEHVCQNTINYKKLQISSKHYCQAYADMIRVANDSVVQSLRRGRVVESVTVYGMLVSHDDLRCIPMRYSSDFKSDPIIEHGLKVWFTEFLYCILDS